MTDDEAGGGSDYCNNNNSQQMPPPVMNSESLVISDADADGTWTLLDDLSTLLGVGGDGFLPPPLDNHPDNNYYCTKTTTTDTPQNKQINGGAAAEEEREGSLLLSSLLLDDDTHHQLPPPPPPEEKQPAAVDVCEDDDDDERVRMALAADVSAALSEDEMATVMMTLPDMLRMAEECGKQEATAGSYWSLDERKHLLYRLHRYAKDDNAFRKCFVIAFYLSTKTAKEVALRYRWLLDKEKTAKQAQLVDKDSAPVSLNKVQGTKGTKKNNKMYPLSKEVLDSKSTRELLRDSIIFMQQIEENIKAGKLDGDTADNFYYVKTSIDAIGKRENEFCRISIPMPPIDEQGLEGILRQSRHSSSVGEEAV